MCINVLVVNLPSALRRTVQAWKISAVCCRIQSARREASRSPTLSSHVSYHSTQTQMILWQVKHCDDSLIAAGVVSQLNLQQEAWRSPQDSWCSSLCWLLCWCWFCFTDGKQVRTSGRFLSHFIRQYSRLTNDISIILFISSRNVVLPRR